MANNNRAYQRYFEGYTEIKEDDGSGKQKIRRIYTGWYYKNLLSDEDWKRLRKKQIALYLTSVAAFVVTGLLPSDAGNNRWQLLPMMVVLLALFFLLFPFVEYFRAPREFEMKTYRQLKRIRTAIGVGILGFLLCLATSLTWIIYFRDFNFSNFLLCILEAVGFICLALWLRLENNQLYDRRKSDQKVTGVKDAYEVEVDEKIFGR